MRDQEISRMNTAPPEKSFEEKTSDRIPDLARLIFFVGLIVSAYDYAVIRQGKLNLQGLGIFGIALLIVGICLYFISRLTLGRFFSEAIKIKPEHRLITGGPYRFIRHPIYLGEILYFLSIPVIFGSLYGFIVMLVLVPMLIHRIGVEERVLVTKFGQEYIDYTQKTKKLIPCFY
jgi:protein-S-isoprenylcysteine O-methyltransferase Ste14